MTFYWDVIYAHEFRGISFSTSASANLTIRAWALYRTTNPLKKALNFTYRVIELIEKHTDLIKQGYTTRKFFGTRLFRQNILCECNFYIRQKIELVVTKQMTFVPLITRNPGNHTHCFMKRGDGDFDTRIRHDSYLFPSIHLQWRALVYVGHITELMLSSRIIML